MQESTISLESLPAPKKKFDFKRVLQYLLAKGVSTQEWLGRKQTESKFMPHWKALKGWLTQFSGNRIENINKVNVLSYLDI